MEINIYLDELLFEKNEVALPGLGLFYAQYQAAIIDKKTKTLQPPLRVVQFKYNPQIEDNTLIMFLSSNAKLTRNEAKKMVENFVININNQLNKGQKVAFKNIGILYKNASDNQMKFEPNLETNFMLDSFGLDTVDLKKDPTKKNIKPEKFIVKKTDTPNKPTKNVAATIVTPINKNTEKKDTVKDIPKKKTEEVKPVKNTPPVKKQIKTLEKPTNLDPNQRSDNKKNRPIWLIPALIVLLIAIPVVLYFTKAVPQFTASVDNVITSIKQKYASNTTDNKKANTTKINNNSAKNVEVIKFDSTLLAKTPIIDSETNQKVEENIKELNKYKKFNLIVGSFQNIAYADQLRNKLIKEGFTGAEVLPKEGHALYRVTLGAYNNLEEAVQTFDLYNNTHNNSTIWLLVNK